ncbi:hypothetical protein ACQQ2N_08565 [Dokdonella sp. MW10]|uniref:hypothetical protein n=1 Tax=Dokdonella sp. MW10 TaxID=2992926 RepID=UPI003F7E00E8
MHGMMAGASSPYRRGDTKVPSLLAALILAMLASSPAVAASCPASVARWMRQAAFFSALDASDEAAFKASLKRYYVGVYRGALLERMQVWIEETSVESEGYAAFYDDLRDTTYTQAGRMAGDRCVVEAVRRSCHDVVHDPWLPVMATLVSDHRVTNVTQAQVDAWLASGTPHHRFCMTVASRTSFVLADDLIVGEDHEIQQARVELEAP